MLKKGIKYKINCTVSDQMTAKCVGSGRGDVLATPYMMARMEEAAYRSVEPFLDEGEGTVGTLMNVKHISPTPVGAHIVCESELIEIDGRRLVFKVKASDNKGLIGEGQHERVIINNKKFIAKAEAKLN